jgi:tetratricopeptide (TPR) repeat protein
VATPLTAFAQTTPAQAVEPAPQAKAPVSPTTAQLATLRNGIKLHDEGKYEEAIALYQSVLTESPDCVQALGELATSYIAKKEFAKGIEAATRALAYTTPSAYKASMYMLVGSAYDDMGDATKAIDTYKTGIAIAPSGLLHYNYALALKRQDKYDEALENLKRAAILTPDHASTHLLIAEIFFRKRYLSQTLFALSRFLILEPRTARTGDAYRMWFDGWQAGVTVNADGKVNVAVITPPDAAEGNFLQMDVTVGVSRAGAMASAAGKTQAQAFVQQLDFWFSSLTKIDQTGADRTAFAWR